MAVIERYIIMVMSEYFPKTFLYFLYQFVIETILCCNLFSSLLFLLRGMMQQMLKKIQAASFSRPSLTSIMYIIVVYNTEQSIFFAFSCLK